MATEHTPREPFAPLPGGRAFPVANPTPDNINFRELADALARLCRHNGFVSSSFYSVAQFQYLVCDLVAEHDYGDAEVNRKTQLRALLADSHVAYVGHVPDGVRHGMADSLAEFDSIAFVIQRAVFAAAGIEWNDPEAFINVGTATICARNTEARDILNDPNPGQPVHGQRIRPMHWVDAADAWYTRLQSLTGRGHNAPVADDLSTLPPLRREA